MIADMRDIAAMLQQRNLDNAVLLAQQAARRPTELSDYFAEIGRRFSHLLDAPEKPTLRVVKGGAG